jgi:hypothetical protein
MTREEYWNAPSQNVYMPNVTQGEVVMDWLSRHKTPKEGEHYVFYHGTPKRGGATDMLRGGSLLADDPQEAIHYAGRDRDLKPGSIKVIKVLVDPRDLLPGHFPSLRVNYPIKGERAGFEKSIPVKGYIRTKRGKLERVKPSVRQTMYVHTEEPISPDATPSIISAIGPSGKKYFVENIRLYPTSPQQLTYGNLVELQKTSPSTRVTVGMNDRDVQIEVRWLALPEVQEKEMDLKLTEEYPPQVLPKGVPHPGQYVMMNGTWARVERVEKGALLVKKIYDDINLCPSEVNPNAEYPMTFEEAARAKALKEQWEEFYVKHFFEATPIAEPRDERERQIMAVENSRLRHKHDCEQANVYDAEGKLVLMKDGSNEAVKFTAEEGGKFYGTVMTHNHPEPAPFSDDDVKYAFMVGLSEMRAVTDTFLYIIKPPPGQSVFNPSKTKKAVKLFDDARVDSYLDFSEALDAGRINISDMNEVGWDDVMNRFAQKSGIQYERLRWPDAQPRREGGYHYR